MYAGDLRAVAVKVFEVTVVKFDKFTAPVNNRLNESCLDEM